MMSLLNCYIPVFRLATTLFLEPQHHQDYGVFRSQCMSLLDEAMQASELHNDPEECEAAFFAVVAYIDERVLCTKIPWSKEWRGELLQMHYFNISVGGEVFFERFDAIDKNNSQLRMVYLFCLLMGFHGKYTQQDDPLLKQKINTERLCLPEAWQQWPNEACIVEQGHGLISGASQRCRKLRQRKWLLCALPFLTYIVLLLLSYGILTG